MDASAEIWVVTDGRAGNEAQALGLAEAVARRRSAIITRLSLPPARWAAALPGPLVVALDRAFAGRVSGAAALAPPWPQLVIGAGRRSAPALAWLRSRFNLAAVQLLSPRIRADAFDAVIVPDHDRLRGPNVLASLGAVNRITPARVADAANAWRARLAHLPKPRLAVMVGGPSRSAQFTTSDEHLLVEALGQLTETHGLMITVSRRTPERLAQRLAALSADCTFVWAGQGDNPYPGILGLAEAALVTADSVNMASEAATAGLPVHVFPLTRIRPKFVQFHAHLSARQASRPFRGKIETWSYTPLAEADEIAAELAKLGIFA